MSHLIMENILGMARHLDDIGVFTKLMGFTLSHVMGAFKIWIWYSKSKEINETVHLIEDSEIFKYETTKTFETDTITMAAIKKSRFVTWVDFILGITRIMLSNITKY